LLVEHTGLEPKITAFLHVSQSYETR